MFGFLRKGKQETVSPADVKLEAFQEHWRQIKPVLENTGPWSVGNRTRESIESGVISVRANVNSLTHLLVEELRTQSQLGPLLEFTFEEKIFKRLCVWARQPGIQQEQRIIDQLRMYEMLISESDRCILHDKPLLEPMFSLLAHYQTSAENLELDQIVSQLNQSLCLWIGRDPTLLPVFFCCGQEDQGKTGFLLFSMLVQHVYRDGPVGDRARDSMLLIFSHSARCAEVSEYIANNSNFCPVLAAGLSGLYSSLPRRLEFRGDEFCSLERHHWDNVPTLRSFMQSLLFINSVCELAEQQVCESLLSYLHSGFLVPVLAPSLHKPNQEETLCSIAYLDLFVRSVTSEPLLKLLLRFIVLHEYEGVPLLDTLTQTLGSNHRECLAALSLFSTLISIQCEDLMFQLIFRYLIPGSHMLWTQRGLIRQNENLVISAEKFLNLTPKESFKGKNSGTNFRITEDLFLSADETAEIDEADEELVATDLALVGAVPGAIDQIPFSYMDYLEDASARIAESRLSCATWLYDYDGIDPPPNFISENTDLFTPLHGLVATRTQEALVNFDIENNDLPSLDELGIESITSKPQSLQRANSTSNQAKVFEKVERPRNNKVKTEVDDFYRSLMNSEEISSVNMKECDDLDLSVDLKDAEESFMSDITAVEAQMNSSLGEANSEVESFELPSTAETVEELETVCEENANERSILELGHLEEQLTTLGDHFLDAQASTTIHVPIKKAGTPFLGPFLSTLFGRLEQMPTNSLYLNLMLTGVVTKLCSMPQPLLRGFLLDTRVVFQPGVPTLFSVLTKVKGKLNAFAVSCADFNSLCARANQFLLQREEDPIIIEDDKGSSTPFDLKKFENVIKGKKDKAEKFIKAAQLNLAMREKHSSDPLRLKNGIFATVILREFAKELAALAHEHAILY